MDKILKEKQILEEENEKLTQLNLLEEFELGSSAILSIPKKFTDFEK